MWNFMILLSSDGQVVTHWRPGQNRNHACGPGIINCRKYRHQHVLGARICTFVCLYILICGPYPAHGPPKSHHCCRGKWQNWSFIIFVIFILFKTGFEELIISCVLFWTLLDAFFYVNNKQLHFMHYTRGVSWNLSGFFLWRKHLIVRGIWKFFYSKHWPLDFIYFTHL